jgi:hypothetical protein
MNLTPEQQARLHLLSDGELYQEAQRFIRDYMAQYALPADAGARQFMGLLQFSRTWKELQEFVKHQRKRDWPANSRWPDFYRALETTLTASVRQRAASFAVPGLTKKEQSAQTDEWSDLLAREFIQHLYAESRYHLALAASDRPQRRNNA